MRGRDSNTSAIPFALEFVLAKKYKELSGIDPGTMMQV